MNLPDHSLETVRQPPEYGEVRVRLPFHLYVRLHSLKLLSGRRLSDIMATALERYLVEEVRARPPRVRTSGK